MVDIDPGRAALVSDRLTVFGGAERVLKEMATVLGTRRVYATFVTVDTEGDSPLADLDIQTSFLQRLPFRKRLSKLFLPLEPLAVEQFDLRDYDLVVSSSHAVAKGCITGPEQVHVSMVYSPMRYAWDLQEQYLQEMGASRGLKGWCARPMLHRLRNWDALSGSRPDHLIAISQFIARRIRKCWRRDSEVIYPPVDIQDIALADGDGDHYVVASRMVPYKRFDLIVEAFKRMPGRRLVVVGDGVDFKRVKRIAQGCANIELKGYLPTAQMREVVGNAKAFVFAAVEDFGIAPLEAQAAGVPVIALGRGGSAETIIDGTTGVLFPDQTVESLMAAVDRFEGLAATIDPHACRANSERFATARFHQEFTNCIDRCMETFRRAARLPH